MGMYRDNIKKNIKVSNWMSKIRKNIRFLQKANYKSIVQERKL